MARRLPDRPERKMRVLAYPTDLRPVLTVEVTRGDEVGIYNVTLGSSPYGPCYCWEHAEDDARRYFVVVLPDGSTCTCPGHLYRGQCKHQDATLRLLAERPELLPREAQPAAREQCCGA